MQRSHRRAHARIWAMLAFLLPLALFGALALRQNGPVEQAAVRVEALDTAAGEASE